MNKLIYERYEQTNDIKWILNTMNKLMNNEQKQHKNQKQMVDLELIIQSTTYIIKYERKTVKIELIIKSTT